MSSAPATEPQLTPTPAPTPSFRAALVAGGVAGTTVDVSLFPLDTLKTRLQAREGFFASGGFRGVYRGLGSAVVGSAPGAAFFFCTYEGVKRVVLEHPALIPGGAGAGAGTATHHALAHMLAASLGEVAARAVRVPTEVVKQRAQAGQHGGSSWAALRAILSLYNAQPETGGGGLRRVRRELYRGWGITVLREVPFTVIQFPLWEALKAWGRGRRQRFGSGNNTNNNNNNSKSKNNNNNEDVSAAESALYGSVSGAVAAFVTTPLDVLKTRVMLSSSSSSTGGRVLPIMREIWAGGGGVGGGGPGGLRPFFAGVGPRVAWIGVGGAVFLGSYQWAVNALQAGGF